MRTEFSPTIGNVLQIAELLRRKVNANTSSRVRNLDIKIEYKDGDTKIFLRGLSDTYYVKLLAQQPFRDLESELPGILGINHFPEINNEIEVR